MLLFDLNSEERPYTSCILKSRISETALSCLCRFGRRFVVLLSLLFLMVFGVGVAFSPNIYVFIVLRFLGGISVSGIVANSFVIGRYDV